MKQEMTKTLNKVTLIGNLVRKPDLRKTEAGVSVCTFHVITEREWRTGNEEKRDTMRHICVAWDKLAEICHEILDKGTLVYIEGRLESHKYKDNKGYEKDQTEIIIEEMIKLQRSDIGIVNAENEQSN